MMKTILGLIQTLLGISSEMITMTVTLGRCLPRYKPRQIVLMLVNSLSILVARVYY